MIATSKGMENRCIDASDTSIESQLTLFQEEKCGTRASRPDLKWVENRATPHFEGPDAPQSRYFGVVSAAYPIS